MEENPPRVGSQKAGPTRKNSQCEPLDDEAGDPIKCSGDYCGSCTGGLVADCVALCCCPCAVVTFLGLALVKAPWMMGKRCLGLGKKQRKCEKIDGNVEMGGAKEEKSEIVSEVDTWSERFEAEGVWLELYQLGHLSFGRVSFSGIQSQGKGN